MQAFISRRYRAILPLVGILVLLNGAHVARPQDAALAANAEHPANWTGLPKLPGGWTQVNGENGETNVTDGALRIAPVARTNLFHAPDGGFDVVNAPMVLFAPEGDFTLKAKVSAQLVGLYDVGALILYDDDRHWAKLCFENSAMLEATIVTVVTRELSDDANSETIASPFIYLAIARKGNDFSFHFSRDGQQWRLAREFQMVFSPKLRAGFAAQAWKNPHFAATFSEIAYHAGAPKNMRQLEPADVAGQ